jgi:hypothetical protein
VKFIRETLNDIHRNVDFAYTAGTHVYIESRGHQSLQAIRARVEVLENFLNSIITKEPT